MNIASTNKTQAPIKVVAQQAPKAKDEAGCNEPKDSFNFAESYAKQSKQKVNAFLSVSPIIGGGVTGYKVGGAVAGPVGASVGLVAGVVGGGFVAHKIDTAAIADKITDEVDSKFSPKAQALIYGAAEVGLYTAMGGAGFGLGVALGSSAVSVGIDYFDHRSEQKQKAS